MELWWHCTNAWSVWTFNHGLRADRGRREHFRDSAIDYEAVQVQRNAPRWIKALTKFGFITPASA